jgi:hypothetical protein
VCVRGIVKPMALGPTSAEENLSPTQAGIDLALPRGNTGTAVFEVSVDALDSSKLGGSGRVAGNVNGRAGGGVEVRYGGTIPPGGFRRIK